MILSQRPVTLAESKSLLKTSEKKEPIEEFFKIFTKLSPEKTKSCIDELRKLNNPKLKEEHLIKIIDILPEDSAELAVIFNEVSLTEEESNAVLAILSKY